MDIFSQQKLVTELDEYRQYNKLYLHDMDEILDVKKGTLSRLIQHKEQKSRLADKMLKAWTDFKETPLYTPPAHHLPEPEPEPEHQPIDSPDQLLENRCDEECVCPSEEDFGTLEQDADFDTDDCDQITETPSCPSAQEEQAAPCVCKKQQTATAPMMETVMAVYMQSMKCMQETLESYKDILKQQKEISEFYKSQIPVATEDDDCNFF